jgi:Tfp pilus assembly protein PilF
MLATFKRVSIGLILKKQGQWGRPPLISARQCRPIPTQSRRDTSGDLALAQEGKLDEATDHLPAALRIDPRSAEAHRSVAEVLMCDGRSDEAEEQFQEARRLRPETDRKRVPTN